MARRTKKKNVGRESIRPHWWASLDAQKRKRVMRGGGKLLVAVVVLVMGAVGLVRLDAHVKTLALQQQASAVLTFPDLPESLRELAYEDLHYAVADLLGLDWLDDRLCQKMAQRLEKVGWIAKVNYVRRYSDGRFEVSARYRQPVAMVQQGADFLLLDAEGVRLPGSYDYSPRWKVIQGVAAASPPAGTPWPGEDVQAALAIIAVLAKKDYDDQITGVLVENIRGRLDDTRSHIELATDRAGGRIRWGSAPGLEVEENSVEQKLAILRRNYRMTGRVDAENPVIDISTFPDRFVIPQ